MPAPKGSVLVVDDEPMYGDMIRRMLAAEWTCEVAATGADALTSMGEGRPDFVLCDVQMPEMSGLELLSAARDAGHLDAGVTFIMMSAHGALDRAIACMQAGAYDYISKPFKKGEIELALAKASERERLRGRVSELEAALSEAYRYDAIVARAPAMHKVFEVLRKVADYRATVLITGESGTGKELVARAIHHNATSRRGRFVAVNCGAIPANLLESELFGYVRGAFTDAGTDKRGLFEEADGGTLFLDEIGELPGPLQVKLLRVLQEQEVRRVGALKSMSVDVRVVAATVRDLAAAAKAGEFREDLYYRLNVIPVRLPPLRERTEDIPLLIRHFLEKINQRHGTSVAEVVPEAMRALVAYPWPGNVRELENLVERMVLLAAGDVLTTDDLPPALVASRSPARYAAVGDDLSIKRATREVEATLIRRALERTDGNRTRAAELLEISARALQYKIKDYAIPL